MAFFVTSATQTPIGLFSYIIYCTLQLWEVIIFLVKLRPPAVSSRMLSHKAYGRAMQHDSAMTRRLSHWATTWRKSLKFTLHLHCLICRNRILFLTPGTIPPALQDQPQSKQMARKHRDSNQPNIGYYPPYHPSGQIIHPFKKIMWRFRDTCQYTPWESTCPSFLRSHNPYVLGGLNPSLFHGLLGVQGLVIIPQIMHLVKWNNISPRCLVSCTRPANSTGCNVPLVRLFQKKMKLPVRWIIVSWTWPPFTGLQTLKVSYRYGVVAKNDRPMAIPPAL